MFLIHLQNTSFYFILFLNQLTKLNEQVFKLAGYRYYKVLSANETLVSFSPYCSTRKLEPVLGFFLELTLNIEAGKPSGALKIET